MSWLSPTIVWRTGALFTAAGMTTGAFGAHSLQRRNFSPSSISSWSTASQYLIYNGLALFAISFHPRLTAGLRLASGTKGTALKWALGGIVSGALVFSGSIFGLVLQRERLGKILGPSTPIGGSAMILGYITLAFL